LLLGGTITYNWGDFVLFRVHNWTPSRDKTAKWGQANSYSSQISFSKQMVDCGVQACLQKN